MGSFSRINDVDATSGSVVKKSWFLPERETSDEWTEKYSIE